MSSVDAWLSLAETVAPCRDPAVRERLVVVLALLLAQSDDRPGVSDAVRDRRDAASLLIADALTRPEADQVAGFRYAPEPDFSDAQADRARAAAAALARGSDAAVDDLAALSPDAAAAVVTGLVSAARYDVLARVAVAVPPQRLPVPLLVRTAAAVAPGLPARDALVQAAARTSELQLLRGLAEVVGHAGAGLSAVVPVIEGVATVRRVLGFAPYQWWPDAEGRRPTPPEWDEPATTVERRPAVPVPPDSAGAEPPPPAAAPPAPPPSPAVSSPAATSPAAPSPPVPSPAASSPAAPAPPAARPGDGYGAPMAPPPAPAGPRLRLPWRRRSATKQAEAPPVPPAQPVPAPLPTAEAPVFRGAEPETRQTYPRLDIETDSGRPEVVVVDRPFRLVAGLQARRDRALVAAPGPVFAVGETVEVELVLLFDPASISVDGAARTRLTVSDGDPFPTATFTCTARYGEDLAPQRRVGMQLLRAGQVVGVAWRSLVAVDEADDVAGAPAPVSREAELLDLEPLLEDEPPDLVVSVCRAEQGSTTFVWTAYAADPAVSVPDLPSSSTLEDDVAAFATETRRAVQFSTSPAKDYLDLAGRAKRIGRAIPAGIQDAVRRLAAQPGRTTAPAVLLLTEELSVPWELGTFDPPLADAWGGSSPFLGAHVAVSRWPLSEHKPRPHPRCSVAVRSGAVLTADYEGVPGWGRLESAMAEADEVAALFDPPAARLEPDLWQAVDLFRGTPAGDVLHVALHGQYDAQGDQEGLVLLAKSPTGGATAQFLSPTTLENGELEWGRSCSSTPARSAPTSGCSATTAASRPRCSASAPPASSPRSGT
ncbi:hypothetical protein [Nocardioides sp.]|uniref:hypothetical protein n=1 Tax=Nocardioides sp. TaxID=35761 RepID=UPI003529B45F